MSGRLIFDPILPIWALIALAAVLFAVLVFYVTRGGRASLLRALGLAALGVALLNPAWVEEEREPIADIVALVVDRSASMQIGARAAEAEGMLAQLRAQIEADPSLDLRVIEAAPAAGGTLLYEAIEQGLSDAPKSRLAGVIVLSDGQAHDFPSDMRGLRPFAPIHGVIVGDPAQGDRRLEVQAAPTFGIVGETIEAVVLVDDAARRGERARILVSVNGEAALERSVTIGTPTAIPLTLDRRGRSGVLISTPAGPEELTLINNEAWLSINGVRDRLRVLLVTGEPHAGVRAWRNLLRSDEAVDLVHFTILRPPHKADGVPNEELALIPFPTRELFVEQLDSFDLVIFDRYTRRGVLPMSYFDNIGRYVEDGGALLVTSGPEYSSFASIFRTPLAAILPSRPRGEDFEGAFTPQVTISGARHPIARALPSGNNGTWGPWYRSVLTETVAGAALMTDASGNPLLVVDRVGEGRVAQLNSDQSWLWARGHQGGGPFAELMRRLAHWLMKEPELEEERLDLVAQNGEIAITRRTFGPAPRDVALTDPDGTRTILPLAETSPGEFTARAPRAALGLYTARQGALQAFARLEPDSPREWADVAVTDSVLRPVAEGTGGGIVMARAGVPQLRRVAGNAPAAGAGWLGLRERNQSSVTRAQISPLAPALAIAGLALLAFGLAWRREGR